MIVTYEEDICRIDSYHPIVNGMKHLQQQRKCLLIFFHFILMQNMNRIQISISRKKERKKKKTRLFDTHFSWCIQNACKHPMHYCNQSTVLLIQPIPNGCIFSLDFAHFSANKIEFLNRQSLCVCVHCVREYLSAVRENHMFMCKTICMCM